ncbi:hypothetical protein [Clostridium sp. AN503]|uniref:hypothetical protein n=1 Tax=Clostridium sp. AN503 TaxID=3160598 RepID=UPI0034582532
MAFVIKDPPEFTTDIEQWTRETLADGVEMAKVPEALLNNDVYLRQGIERAAGSRSVALPASGWSGTAPYTQTVSVAGVTAEDAPVIGILIAEGTTAANVKLQNKAWACVDRAVTGAGTITFYCYNKKPGNDFTVNVKGV